MVIRIGPRPNVTKNIMQGKLITIYGINNLGKSTQAKLLVKNLKKQGKRVEYLKYPIYNLKPSGPIINKVLRSGKKQKMSEEELQLWYTINRFQYENTLKKKLKAGKIIVAEDYTGTGLSWGAAKGAKLDWLIKTNEPLLAEDIAILLDGSRFIEAKEKNHIHESNDKLVAKCRRVHLQLAKRFEWKIVKANREVDVIAKEVLKLVK